jgi:hypothetical protein
VWAAWPREGNSDLSKALGRDLSAQLADPGCASLIRLSAAFNRCGAAIAKSSAFSGASIIDAAGFQYLADAASAIKVFKGKLGKPRVVSSEADVLGRAGILAFELAAPKGDKGGGHHDRHAHHNAPGGDAGAHTHAHAPGCPRGRGGDDDLHALGRQAAHRRDARPVEGLGERRVLRDEVRGRSAESFVRGN